MKHLFIAAVAAVFLLSVASAEPKRKAKTFSLFNIVKFQNNGCTSTSSHSGSSQYRNGTCFTASECTSKGGTAAGSCASGFGTCCVFTVSTSGSTISQNCTYIQNTNYPSAYTSASTLKYTVNKCADSVCGLRLDFDSFTIRGPGDTKETDRGECKDTFKISSTHSQNIPTICGKNTGQHVYVEFGTKSSDTVSLEFTTSGTTESRSWEIKTTQIPCGASWRNPEGCLQYFTGLTGRLTTFNFIPTDSSHLQSQNYRACIRQEQGYCCIQYMPCSDTNSLSLDSAKTSLSIVESSCSLDYITIDGGMATCSQGGNQAAPVVTKYCGAKLSPIALKTVSKDFPVCDCTAPFFVGIKTDSKVDSPQEKSRGLCLTWKHIPCA